MSILTNILLEEIALEGLDGITLETLWYRLSNTKPAFAIRIDSDEAKEYLWKAIITLREIEFYQLVEPRPIYQEVEYEVREFGIEIYKPHPSLTLYPCELVNKDGVLGSCSTYDTRQCITEQVRKLDCIESLISCSDAVRKWGNRLVIVASQKIRNRVLFRDATDPHSAQSKILTTMYLYIEHMARCRSQGLNGSDALSHLSHIDKVNHGHMGYLRKKMFRFGLCVKTNILMMKERPDGFAPRVSHDNISFLKRFHTPVDTVYLQLHQTLESYLLDKADKKDSLDELCKNLNLQKRRTARFIRLRRNYFSIDSTSLGGRNSKVVTNEQSASHESMDVDLDDLQDESLVDTQSTAADESSTSGKKGKKKSGRESRTPSLVVTLLKLLDDDDKEEEEEEESGPVNSDVKHFIRTDRPLVDQLADWIDSLGPEGASKVMIKDHFSLHTLQSRQVMKQLKKIKLFHFYYKDSHRQRIEMVCSERFASTHTVTLPILQTGSDSSPVSSHPVSQFSTDKTGRQTGRSVERTQLAIAYTLKHRLILISDLYRLIADNEVSRYSSKLDRKTLKRIVESLSKSGQLSNYRTTIQVKHKKRDLFYVCEPNMELSDPLIQASLEQQRSELAAGLMLSDKQKVDVKPEEKAPQISTEPEIMQYKYDSTVAVAKYGYGAKMKRLETLHKFLSYVLYNYEGAHAADNSTQIPSAAGDVSQVTVYLDEMSWRRFIPPDILQDDVRGSGYAYLLDLGTQLPLNMFLTVVKILFDVPLIHEYLNDPVKRFLPVRHLPLDLLTALLFRRKYIGALRDNVALLCMMGLASNTTLAAEGSGTFRELTSIYLHKTGCVKDTTDVYDDMKICELTYNLDGGMQQVDEYWMTLRSICISTTIRKTAPKQDDTLSISNDIYRKEILKSSSKAKSLNEIEEGVIPGDGLGAGGLDSSFFAHLSKQWTTCFEKIIPNPVRNVATRKRLANASSIEERRKQLSLTNPITIGTKTVPLGARAPNATTKRRTFDAKNSKTAKKRKLQSERKVEKNKKSKTNKPLVDEVDLQANARMETTRAQWDASEDAVLVLCRVALLILNTRDLSGPAIRNMLHKHVHRSRDKSSAASLRRLHRVTRNEQASINLYHSLALKSKEVEPYIGKEPNSNSSSFTRSYEQLMSILIVKFDSSVSDLDIDLVQIGSVEALRTMYDIISPDTEEERNVEWLEPTTENEIAKSTLYNFILGYLLLSNKSGCNYQMQKVFEQYPSIMPDDVVKTLNQNKVIILRSKEKVNMRKFALSRRYSVFMEKVQVLPVKYFTDSGEALAQLRHSCEGISLSNMEESRGELMNLITLSSLNLLNVNFDLPERVLDITDIDESGTQDNDDDDDEDDEELVKARAMQYEHCTIKPCTVKYSLSTTSTLPDRLLGQAIDDRRYIRALMKHIPFNMDVEKSLKLLDTTDLNYTGLYVRIEAGGVLGLTACELSSSDLELIGELIRIDLVVVVGVTKKRFVSHGNSRMWIVHTLQNTKGRATGISLTDDDRLPLGEEMDYTKARSLFEVSGEPASTYQRVDIIPRPWLTPEGTLNYKLLFTLLSAVMSCICMSQGIKQSALLAKFCMCYSPACISELVQVLEDLGCVKIVQVKQCKRVSLFSKRPEISYAKECIGSDVTSHLIATNECILRLGQFMNNTDQSRDLSQ